MPPPVGPRHEGQSESVDAAPQTVARETTRLIPVRSADAQQRQRMALPEDRRLEYNVISLGVTFIVCGPLFTVSSSYSLVWVQVPK
jgi:hypothetical protein